MEHRSLSLIHTRMNWLIFFFVLINVFSTFDPLNRINFITRPSRCHLRSITFARCQWIDTAKLMAFNMFADELLFFAAHFLRVNAISFLFILTTFSKFWSVSFISLEIQYDLKKNVVLMNLHLHSELGWSWCNKLNETRKKRNDFALHICSFGVTCRNIGLNNGISKKSHFAANESSFIVSFSMCHQFFHRIIR